MTHVDAFLLQILKKGDLTSTFRSALSLLVYLDTNQLFDQWQTFQETLKQTYQDGLLLWNIGHLGPVRIYYMDKRNTYLLNEKLTTVQNIIEHPGVYRANITMNELHLDPPLVLPKFVAEQLLIDISTTTTTASPYKSSTSILHLPEFTQIRIIPHNATTTNLDAIFSILRRWCTVHTLLQSYSTTNPLTTLSAAHLSSYQLQLIINFTAPITLTITDSCDITITPPPTNPQQQLIINKIGELQSILNINISK